jgi:hypothetical protein
MDQPDAACSVAIDGEATFLAKGPSDMQENAAENSKYVERKTSRPSKFITDSSPAGKKAGVRHDAAQSTTEASILCRNNPRKSLARG